MKINYTTYLLYIVFYFFSFIIYSQDQKNLNNPTSLWKKAISSYNSYIHQKKSNNFKLAKEYLDQSNKTFLYLSKSFPKYLPELVKKRINNTNSEYNKINDILNNVIPKVVTKEYYSPGSDNSSNSLNYSFNENNKLPKINSNYDNNLLEKNKKLSHEIKQLRKILKHDSYSKNAEILKLTNELIYYKNKLLSNNDSKFKKFTKELTIELEEKLNIIDDLNLKLKEYEKSKLKNEKNLALVEKNYDLISKSIHGDDNVNKSKKTPLNQLIKRNNELIKKIQNMEVTIDNLSEKDKQKDKLINNLKIQFRKDLHEVEQQRNALTKQNEIYAKAIDKLEWKLMKLSSNLDEVNSLIIKNSDIRKDNIILRSTILNQLRSQSRMKHATSLLIENIKKNMSSSSKSIDLLISNFESLPQIYQLSEKEKSLFKTSKEQALINLFTKNESSSINFSKSNSNVISGTLTASSYNKSRDINSNLIKKSISNFKSNNFKEAEKNLYNHLSTNPKDVEAICNLAIIKMKTKEYDLAQNHLKKALLINPKFSTPYFLMGRINYLQENFDKAIRNLDNSIKYNPKNSKSYNYLGIIYSKKGFIKKAKESFISALNIDPNYGDAHFNLAALHFSLKNKNVKKIKAHYNKAISLGVSKNKTIDDFIKNKS